ncbi:MAG: TonB-dependent receptor [Gammaproteobacteria bacterium]|nr:TonB-dependent receptor [Gammaproteobacteria bacterium]
MIGVIKNGGMLSKPPESFLSGLVLFALLGGGSFVFAQPAELQDLTVEQALSTLEAEGLELFYSSDLIKPWMRVTEPRTATDPRLWLAEILAPLGLTTRAGPGDSLLIVRADAVVGAPPPSGSLFGVVSEQIGQRLIAGATVTLEGAGRRSTTDSEGRFLFTDLAASAYAVTVTHPFFASATLSEIEVSARQTVMTAIELSVAPPATIDEIIVAASQYQLTRSASATNTLLTSEDIDYLPDFGDDALRAVSRLPGTTTNGISARSNVRGGEVGETLVRFDNLRLYEPFHLKAFQSVFSTIDPQVISSMNVYTGGFPAVFGDRMSSVVDVASLRTPADRYSEVALSFFNASVLNAGRFGSGDGEWVASIRRSNLDLLYEAFSEQAGQPRYLDAFAKVSYEVNSGLRVTGNYLYFADDVLLTDVDLSREAREKGEDRYLWLRLDHTPNALINGSTLIAHSRLTNHRNGFTAEPGVSTGTLEDHSSFTIGSVQSDWTWTPDENLLFQLGGSFSRLEGRYDYQDEVTFDLLFAIPGAATETVRSRNIQLSPSGHQYALYASVRYSPTPLLTTDFGVRWDKQTLDPARSDTVGPRLGFRFQLADRTYLRGSWGRFYQSQGINELQVGDGVQQFFAPQRSDHTVIGIEHEFLSGLKLRGEAYDKNMDSLRPRYENFLNTLILLPELKPDRIRVAPSSARARGVELFLNQRLQQPVTWWFGYSYSWVEDQIEGSDILRSWDQTHAVSAGLNWDTPKWNLGLGLIYRSGWPTTPVAVQSTAGNVPIIGTSDRNSDRLDFYRSADFRLTRKFDIKGSSLSVFLEIANLFGRKNPCCLEYEIDDETGVFEAKIRDYMPLIPSVGFVWTF